MKRQISLHNVLFHIVSPLVPLLILGTLSIVISQGHLRRTIDEKNVLLLRQAQDTMDMILDNVEAMAFSFSHDPLLVSGLKSVFRMSSLDEEDFRIVQMTRSISELFTTSLTGTKPFVDSVYVYYENDNDRFITSLSGLSSISRYPDQGWFAEFRRSDGGLKSWGRVRDIRHFSFETTARSVVSFYRRLYSPGMAQGDGIIVVNFRKQEIERFLGESTIVLDRDGQVLFSGPAAGSFTGIDPGLLENVRRSEQPVFPYTADRETFIMTHVGPGRYGWNFLSVTPGRVLYRVPLTLVPITIILFCISLLIGISLNATFQRLRESERGYRVRMIELLALQAQINPHFVFNTLETLSWKAMALTDKPNMVTFMIENLSDILKYSLKEAPGGVTLAEEIQNTRSYIEIQKIRYRDRFEVGWNCGETALGCRTPRLLLQPLVENSIHHGIVNLGRSCRIEIVVRLQDGRVVVTVSDDGCGIPAPVLKTVREGLTGAHPAGEHIGLANIYRRLLLMYGKGRFSMTLESSPGSGTLITLSFPAEPISCPVTRGALSSPFSAGSPPRGD